MNVSDWLFNSLFSSSNQVHSQLPNQKMHPDLLDRADGVCNLV